MSPKLENKRLLQAMTSRNGRKSNRSTVKTPGPGDQQPSCSIAKRDKPTEERSIKRQTGNLSQLSPWTTPGSWFYRVYNYLEWNSQLITRLVCKAWSSAIMRTYTTMPPIWFCTDDKLTGMVKPATFLTHIELRSCALLTDSGLHCLTYLPRLETLILKSAYQITHKTLNYLQTATQLRSLCLDAAISLKAAPIGNLPSLVNLSLAGCSNLRRISLLEAPCQLTQLILNGCITLSDGGLQCLSKAPALAVLDISGCNTSDSTIDMLQQCCPSLKVLFASCCQRLTNTGLALISEMAGLQQLDLNGCTSISDFGLAKLAELPNLNRLALLQCPRVTRSGLLWMLDNSQSEVIRTSTNTINCTSSA